MAFPVKYYRDTQTGAPVLSGQAGALIALLDACLIDGFNSHALDSLTSDGAGTATATVSGGHGYEEGNILLIEGADQAEYNGEVKIAGVTATTFDFAVIGTPTTPATGTVTAKIAPVGGWTRPFSGTDVAVYRQSTGNGLPGAYYRVDDSDAQHARVVMYETMTDVDTGSGPAPTAAQLDGGAYWTKSSTANSAARPWLLVADEGLLYWLPAPGSTSHAVHLAGCHSDPWKAGDLYHAVLGGATSIVFTNSQICRPNGVLETNSRLWMARSYNQIGGAVELVCWGHARSGFYTGFAGEAYPAAADGGLRFAPVMLSEESTEATRGMVAGLHHSMQVQPLTHGDTVPGALDGRDLLVATVFTANQEGRVFFDIDGPWR